MTRISTPRRSSAPAASSANNAARVTKTAGSYTVNGTSYVDLDTSTDIVIAAAAGQWIEVGATVAWQNEATYGFLDVITVAGSNYISGAGSAGHGVTSWVGATSQLARTGGSIIYRVVSGDISAGLVTLRFRVKTLAASNKTLLAVANDPLVLWARNIG